MESSVCRVCQVNKPEKGFRFPEPICASCLQDKLNAFLDEDMFLESDSESENSNLEEGSLVGENLEEKPQSEQKKVKNGPLKEEDIKEEHYPISNSNINQENDDYIIDIDLENTEDQPYTCPQCHKSFVQSISLQAHLQTHAKKRECFQCSKTFTTDVKLKSHFLHVHSDERPFKCTVCPKDYRLRSKLHRHLRVHTGVRPFKCTHCSRTFTQGQYLKAHIRTHTGERPYKCPLCTSCFAQASSLRSHVRIHTT
nr:gastrula zinc finger protein XlCGF7.1-like [Drosophila suzukii]